MKNPIIFSVFFFIISAIFSFGQGVWIEEEFGPSEHYIIDFRTGKFEINGRVYEIKPNANLEGVNLDGANLEGVNLDGANLRDASLIGANLVGATLSGANLEGADFERANLTGSLLVANWETNFSRANFSGADLTESVINITPGSIEERYLGNLLTAVSKKNYNEIKELEPKVKANTTKINELDGILSSADETLEGFSQNIDILNANDQSIAEQMAILSQNDESIMTEIDAIKAQLQTLVASVAEKDRQIAFKDRIIATLERRPTIEQVRDARAGSVVLTVEPDGNNITLGLTIEQSDNLTEWTKLDGEMTRTIPIPDGKKFYRFALDK